jgi:hypothetical protein
MSSKMMMASKAKTLAKTLMLTIDQIISKRKRVRFIMMAPQEIRITKKVFIIMKNIKNSKPQIMTNSLLKIRN